MVQGALGGLGDVVRHTGIGDAGGVGRSHLQLCLPGIEGLSPDFGCPGRVVPTEFLGTFRAGNGCYRGKSLVYEGAYPLPALAGLR